MDLKIVKTEIDFKIKSNDQFWDQLVSDLRAVDMAPSDDNECDIFFLGPIFNESIDDGKIFHEIFLAKNDDSIDFNIEIKLKPDGEAPEPLIIQSKKLNQAKIYEKILALITSNKKIIADARYTAIIDGSKYLCTSFQKISPVDLSPFCDSAINEAIGYRINGGINGVNECYITYFHTQDIYELKVNAKGILKEFKSLIDIGEKNEILHIIAETFFRKAESVQQ
ncbi:hypothetical protein [Deefgea rivuli]|uniref:hypothetical protein n=1 Tax=Deefgea rivuli TaxID=400948 RepID=UPI0004838BF3|nr:hypothetical protein [Deefgea rivuli]